MVESVIEWIFSAPVFVVGAVLAISIGLGLALSSAKEDVPKANWFFGAGFVWTMGRVAQLVDTVSPKPLRYTAAACLCAVIGIVWVASHDWVAGKIQQSKQQPAGGGSYFLINGKGAEVSTPAPTSPATPAPNQTKGNATTSLNSPVEDVPVIPAQPPAHKPTHQPEPKVPKPEAIAVPTPATTTVMVAPSYGNLKQRCLDEASNIDRAIIQRKTFEGTLPRDPITNRNFLASTDVTFRQEQLPMVQSVRDEFADKDFKDPQLDKILEEDREETQMDARMPPSDRIGYFSNMYLWQQVAERLRALAQYLP